MDDNTLPAVQNDEAVPEEVVTLESVSSAINVRTQQLESLKVELKKQKEMLESYLLNDSHYKEALETAKRANQIKNQAKQMALKQPGAAGIPEKLIEMKAQEKEINEGLSYYLREYQRLTGLSEFEGTDGEVRQIVYVAKLVKRSVFKK
jgi:hypothetical protein